MAEWIHLWAGGIGALAVLVIMFEGFMRLNAR